MQQVPVECTFFTLLSGVYKSIRMGSLYASEGVPSSVHLLDSFSVFTFLQFCPGATSPMLSPWGVVQSC